MNQDKKKLINKIIASTTLTACFCVSSFSLAEQVLATDYSVNTSVVTNGAVEDAENINSKETTEETTAVEEKDEAEVVTISPEGFEQIKKELLPLTDKELKGIVNNQRIDPKMVVVAKEILSERAKASEVEKSEKEPSTQARAEAVITTPSTTAPIQEAPVQEDVPVVPTTPVQPDIVPPSENGIDTPSDVQPNPQAVPETTPQPPTPVTPAPPIINDDMIPSTGGPVKQWKGIPKDSKRYQLKKAAESMLGWRYSQPSRMRPGYRDCSSFVHTAIAKAGFCPEPAWAWTTYTMPYFTDVVYRIPMNELRPGDIVLGDGHVAFYWGTDVMGYPQTLECCWGYGVTYGYMMSNGWNFPYTQAYRVKNIDTKSNGEEIDFGNYQPPNIPAYPESNPYTQDAVHTGGMYGDYYNRTSAPVATGSGTVASAPQTEGTDLSTGAMYHDPNAIVMTPEKMDGKIIDIDDLEKNPIRTIDLYLSKDMNDFETQELQQLATDEEKLTYLIGKVAFYREDAMAAYLARYLDIEYKAKKDYDLDTLAKSVKDSFVVADQPADMQLLIQKLILHTDKDA